LSDADALIESLEQLIAKKRQIKQGTMQELLTGKKRLPGFSGAWKVKPLADVAPLQRGFDLPNSKLQQGPYPVVYSNGILNHHTAFQVKGPGVVTGRSGTIGAVTFIEKNFWPHNTSLWVTNFKSNDPKFVFYLYTTIGLERFAIGSGVPTLNRNDVHDFKISIPPTKAEQTAIATIFSDMDAEIAMLEEKLAKAHQVKQGMMQELLTGKTRLVNSGE
jgi:type I restriction enzyme S subunit